MKEYLSFDNNKKKDIIQKTTSCLENKNNIVFAYIFGSFSDAPSFRDIDIGVYMTEIEKDNVFDQELQLTNEISLAADVPFDIVDVKILNFAPDHFLNSIFCSGIMLFCNDMQLLTEMIENTSLNALANEHISNQSLKELVPA